MCTNRDYLKIEDKKSGASTSMSNHSLEIHDLLFGVENTMVFLGKN